MVPNINKIVKKDGASIKKIINKNQSLFDTLQKIKLWTSRTGVLHGIQTIKINGDLARVTTHCGETFTIRNSKNSRVARWIRNRWLVEACPGCRVPEWKLEKYSSTKFIKRR